MQQYLVLRFFLHMPDNFHPNVEEEILLSQITPMIQRFHLFQNNLCDVF